MNYLKASSEELAAEKEKAAKELQKLLKNGVTLDLSRGKPSAEQLDLSLGMLDVIDSRSILDSESGQDCRNYGGLDGIPEAKRLLAHMMARTRRIRLSAGTAALL